jgi:NAD(P)-dependent dehydrogenase (short-subunit alcohol dehydrogenase family)
LEAAISIFQVLQMKMEGKVAVVTGGTSGIGAVLVRRLVAEGATVVFSGRRRDLGTAFAVELGPSAIFVHANAQNIDDVCRTVDRAIAVQGHIDLLVNNAGVSDPYLGILDTNPVHFVVPFNLHVCAPVAHIARAVRHMRGGSVVNIASIAGHAGYDDGRVTYGVSKAALIALTKHMAPELKHFGVRMNCISPGKLGRENFDTVVDAVLYLASARFVSGIELVVDDGLICGPTYVGER